MVPSSLFILVSSVCKSLQCLIFTLTQEGECGHLFRFTCVVGKEGHFKQISLTCVGSSHSVWTTLGCPSSQGGCFPGLHYSGSKLLCKCTVQSALCFMHFPGLSCQLVSQFLHKGTNLVGHEFCALPRSEKLKWPDAWQGHCSMWTMCLNLLPGPSCLVS